MMKPLVSFVLLAATSPLLGGCLPMMAVSAASMAAQGAEGRPTSNEAYQPQARDSCTQQAARYGTVSIIDVEQHRVDKIIVWGTVDDSKQKRSFECDFSTRITAFKLRPITPH
jgi:hypothetical protein